MNGVLTLLHKNIYYTTAFTTVTQNNSSSERLQLRKQIL